MYLLDTNHCSAIILGEPKVINRIIEVGELNIATCVIVQGELTYMMENSAHRESNLASLTEFLQDIRIYNVIGETANIYGQLKAALMKQFGPKEKSKRRKTQVTDLGFDENDLWIAAIALQHGLKVVSDDSDFQRIQQVRTLSVESWL
ncbi:type II toxin-antitoxin system VapC family toxin [Calothrix sp. FACHB-1219]|uniref:type II toxin-antitoxin system VapC family toxin n=1 Tax=unclassified Calothrix TaxID=2619626 RepID=UPI001687405B|nr:MULTISPECIES: type II toxin-antitoxin system VapC family toxin [unclassified Calothrix]MBD2200972.1 type II toxin-antitoxin system VapC family toxin [Calothrix sp. FACHB-168]MBD2219750.1 type II toxin-antitoxin system VapC family toxin [Calothrix sp. FACHB-1219]